MSESGRRAYDSAGRTAAALRFDFNAPRARRRCLRHRDREHTVRVRRLDLVALDVLRESDRALELAAEPLRGVNAKLFVFLPPERRLLRAAQRQCVILERDVDRRRIDTR